MVACALPGVALAPVGAPGDVVGGAMETVPVTPLKLVTVGVTVCPLRSTERKPLEGTAG